MMDDAASNLTKVSTVLQNRFSLELYDFVATNVPQKTLAPSRDAKPYIFSRVPASSNDFMLLILPTTLKWFVNDPNFLILPLL